MTAGDKRRAVVTGIGVVAPTGVGVEAYWKATAEGACALDAISREGCEDFPLRVVGEVRGFDPQAMVEDTFLVQTDRFSHFAMAAAQLALADARLGRGDLTDPFSVGVVTAVSSGGGEFGQRELQKLWGNGPKHVGPYQSIAWFYAASTGQISIRGGFKGPCGSSRATRRAVWTRWRTATERCAGAPTHWSSGRPRHRSPRTRWPASSGTPS